jgi:hypothetical protein
VKYKIWDRVTIIANYTLVAPPAYLKTFKNAVQYRKDRESLRKYWDEMVEVVAIPQ